MKKLYAIGLLYILASCGRHETSKEALLLPDAKMDIARSVAILEPNGPALAQPPSAERKLIKNGELLFETDHVAKAKIEIDKIGKGLNAYMSSENQSNFANRLEYQQVVRVPADRFDELLLKIEALAIKVENRTINTEDVTAEFIDTEVRLKTKRELETRYREILKQAKTVEEILSIETQIGQVRTDIESAEGRLNYLKNQVAFSTLTITYYETTAVNFGFGHKFIQSISEGWDNLLSFLIGLVAVWPFVIIIAAGAVWFLRRRKKKPMEG